jgi:TonB family protein
MSLLKCIICGAACLYSIGLVSCTSKKTACGPDSAGAVERMPQLLTRIDASYPPLARQAGIEGIVGVKFSIDAKGTVISGEIERTSGSSAGFESECIESGKGCRWVPAYAGGAPIAHWSYLETVFICRWSDLGVGKADPSAGVDGVGNHSSASDSSIEICEVYDSPPSIETTEMVEYTGQESPRADTGSLWMRAVVDDAGEVRYAMVVQSSLKNTQLNQALVRAFCSNQFKPAYSQGSAVATQVEFQIVFAPSSEIRGCYGTSRP